VAELARAERIFPVTFPDPYFGFLRKEVADFQDRILKVTGVIGTSFG
jgi:hypothetical protein